MNWTIKSTEHFKSQYKLLPLSIQALAKGAFEIIEFNALDESLAPHRLRRPLASYHGLSINDEYRIIARIVENKREITLHDIGTHEIYRSFL